jgi:hypothetical protein
VEILVATNRPGSSPGQLFAGQLDDWPVPKVKAAYWKPAGPWSLTPKNPNRLLLSTL